MFLEANVIERAMERICQEWVEKEERVRKIEEKWYNERLTNANNITNTK